MDKHTYFWICMFFLAIGTIIIRYSIIGLSAKIKIPAQIKELFSFVPAAIIPALISPAVFYHHGHVSWLFQKERLFVLIFATGVCYVTKNMIATVAIGLASLYFITFVI